MYQKVKIDEMWAKDFAGDEIMCIFVGMKNDTPTYNLLIAMGTNHNQDHNMALAQRLLTEWLGADVGFSQTLRTVPIGIGGDMFVNCLAWANTDQQLEDIRARLKLIESACGRRRDQGHKHQVNIDLDILLLRGEKMHQDDWHRPYIQTLLRSADICIEPQHVGQQRFSTTG